MSYRATFAHSSTAVADDAAFVHMLRAFFAVALTPDLRNAGRDTTGVHSDIGACRVWHRRLYEELHDHVVDSLGCAANAGR